MRKIFFFALMMLTALGAQAGEKKVYTSYNSSTKTLTYYYDDQYDAGNENHELYDPENKPTALRWKEYHAQVKTVVVDASMQDAPLTSMRGMFYGGNVNNGDVQYSLSNVETISGLNNLNTKNVTTMQSMFNRCLSLKSVDLSAFKTENVENTRYMFIFCKALETLDFATFNFANDTTTEEMFLGCSELKTIYCEANLSNNSKLKHSYNMFKGCTSLRGCQGTQCDGVTQTDKSYAHLDEGEYSPGFFTMPSRVYTVYDGNGTLTYFYDDQYDAENANHEFYDPYDILVTRWWYFKKVKTVEIDPSMKNAPLTSMVLMFYGGPGSGSWHSLSNMTSIIGMENLNTTNVTDMGGMFFDCTSLESIDLSHFDTKNVTNMNGMFYTCTALTELDLRSFDMKNVTNTGSMFMLCKNLTTIRCDEDWSENDNITNSKDMFAFCPKLVGGKGTEFDGAKTDITYARPDEGPDSDQPGYFTRKNETGIEEVTNDQMRKWLNAKIIRDGQVFIQRGEKVYTVTGQEIK